MREKTDLRTLEAIEAAFTQRYVLKKRANLTISMLIAVLLLLATLARKRIPA